MMVIWCKILGSTTIPSDVEKNGFCKSVYGENWKNKIGENICINILNNKERESFSEEEFRNICPQNELISTKFYSDCFHRSGSIS